jgi:putative membrane protein
MNASLIAALAALCFGAACGKQAAPSISPTTATNANAPGAHTPGLATSDLEFLTRASQGGMLEVELGTKAALLGSSPDVKSFGDRMRVDHAQTNALLQQLAVQKGVSLPFALDSEHTKRLDELESLRGTSFDEQFVSDMVQDHQKDVDEFEKAAMTVRDQDVQAWAQRMLPTLRMHLQMAMDMKARSVRSMSTR